MLEQRNKTTENKYLRNILSFWTGPPTWKGLIRWFRMGMNEDKFSFFCVFWKTVVQPGSLRPVCSGLIVSKLLNLIPDLTLFHVEVRTGCTCRSAWDTLFIHPAAHCAVTQVVGSHVHIRALGHSWNNTEIYIMRGYMLLIWHVIIVAI